MSTGSIQPFRPAGTVSVPATTSSANVALGGGGESVLVTNTGNNLAYVRFGADSSVSASSVDMPVLPSSQVLLSVNPLIKYAAAILANGTGNVLFTRGDGSTL